MERPNQCNGRIEPMQIPLSWNVLQTVPVLAINFDKPELKALLLVLYLKQGLSLYLHLVQNVYKIKILPKNTFNYLRNSKEFRILVF